MSVQEPGKTLGSLQSTMKLPSGSHELEYNCGNQAELVLFPQQSYPQTQTSEQEMSQETLIQHLFTKFQAELESKVEH